MEIDSYTIKNITKRFFLTANIQPEATLGKWFQIEIPTGADVTLTNPQDRVNFLPSGGPFLSSTYTIIRANIVDIAPLDQVPQKFFQNNDYVVLSVTATVNVGFVRIDRITIDRIGGDDDDVTSVLLYRREGAGAHSGPIEPVDTPISAAPFASQVATLSMPPVDLIAGTTNVFLIAYRVAPGAFPGNALGAKLANVNAVHAVDSWSTVTGPFPITTSSAPIQATVNHLLISDVVPLGGGGIKQGRNDAHLLTFSLASDKGDFAWQALTVHSTGTALDSDIRSVRIWKETDGGVPEAFAITDSTITADSYRFNAGIADIALSSTQFITTTKQAYYVTVSLSSDAVPGRTIGVYISSSSSFLLSSPNRVSTETAPFPLRGDPAPIDPYPNVVSVGTSSIVSSAGAAPGDQDLGMLELRLNTDVSSARWLSLDLRQTESASDSDLGDVKIYYDIGFNPGNPSPAPFNSSNLGQYVLITSTGQRFGRDGPKAVKLGFNLPQTIRRTTQRYFVTVDLSTSATPTLKVKLQAFGTGAAFELTGGGALSPTNFDSGNPLVINPPPSHMHVEAQSIAPSTAAQGSSIPILWLKAWMDAYDVRWTELRVDRFGSGQDTDVKSVNIFVDENKDGQLQVGVDNPLGSAVFSQGSARLVFLSTQTVGTSTQSYLLTYEVSETAGNGNTLGAVLGISTVFKIVPPHDAAPEGFPIQSNNTTIIATQSGLKMTGTSLVEDLVQNGVDNKMLYLTLESDAYALAWSALTLQSAGTATGADIKSVRIWKDEFPHNALGPEDGEISPRVTSFVGNTAVVSLTEAQVIRKTKSYYWVTVDLAPFATPGKTFGLIIPSSSAFSLSAPNYGINQGFPFATPLLPIEKLPESLVVTPQDVMPEGVNQGQEFTAAKFLARASRNQVTWKSVALTMQGLADAEVKEVRVLRDIDGSGSVSSGDLIIGTGTFQTHNAAVNFSSAQAVGVATQTYLVSMVLEPTASKGAFVVLKVINSSALQVENPDTVSSSGWPFTTLGKGEVQDSLTPQIPVVTVDGPVSGQFEHLHFVWSSTVAFGALTGAWYALGTTPGGTDVIAFTAIAVTATDFKITGFSLRSGSTYYVSVKTESSSAKTSIVGTSIGVLMDFTVPPIPAPAVTGGQAAVLVSWGTVSGGPSGVAGYLIEYRKGDSPVWYNAKTKRRSSVASVASTRADVRVAEVVVSTDELVTGGSFQAADLPSGTLYVRVRSVTGAGVASAPSEPVKVQVGVLPADGISSAANYPNPFDSRKRDTTIVYTLSANADMSIKIYDVYGRLVREIGYGAGGPGGQAGTNEVKWDGTDAGGRKVSKGIYLAVLQSGGAKTILKIGVIH